MKTIKTSPVGVKTGVYGLFINSPTVSSLLLYVRNQVVVSILGLTQEEEMKVISFHLVFFSLSNY